MNADDIAHETRLDAELDCDSVKIVISVISVSIVIPILPILPGLIAVLIHVVKFMFANSLELPYIF